MNHTSVVDRYFNGVRAREPEAVLALFADEATLTLPDGREFAGIAALREWFTGLLATQAPAPTQTATIAGAHGVATENEVHLPDGRVRRTANFFHLDSAGRIVRLSVYHRG